LLEISIRSAGLAALTSNDERGRQIASAGSDYFFVRRTGWLLRVLDGADEATSRSKQHSWCVMLANGSKFCHENFPIPLIRACIWEP
jgi:hypothetical protein